MNWKVDCESQWMYKKVCKKMKLSKEIINEFTKQHLEQTYTILQLYFKLLANIKYNVNHRSWWLYSLLIFLVQFEEKCCLKY